MSFWQPFPSNRLLAELSLWSADAAHFSGAIIRTAPYADLYHIDVSDGHFTPLMLFYPDLVAQLRPLTDIPFHVHLMVSSDILLTQIDHFVSAGANLITIHLENGPIVPAALERIRQAGCATGIALGLDVPPEAIVPYFEQIDIVNMMGTRIGVKGQELDASACDRISTLRRLINERHLQHTVRVGADGGIRQHTVPRLRAAGADTVVMGSLAFGSPDLAKTMAWLHELPLPENR